MKPIARSTKDESGDVYEYELRRAEKEDAVLYCVSVVLRRDGAISAYETPPIFTSLDKARRVYQRAVESLITPADMPYVLEDLIEI